MKRPRLTTLFWPTLMTLSRVVITLLTAAVATRLGCLFSSSEMLRDVRGVHGKKMA